MYNSVKQFSLKDKVIIVTGAAGFLGEMHVRAILDAEGIPILIDVNKSKMENLVNELLKEYNREELMYFTLSITDKEAIIKAKQIIMKKYGHIDALINNACNNPTMKGDELGRFEDIEESILKDDIDVGLYGSIYCSQIFGECMAELKNGVIINIVSDLGIIAPNQNLYEDKNLKEKLQKKKPVTYSISKFALVGLTKYLSTYWSDKNVRVNAIAFGGVFNNQKKEMIQRLNKLIPLGRMANRDEYMGTIIFMLSNASSYMNGAVLTIDGGRTAW